MDPSSMTDVSATSTADVARTSAGAAEPGA
jgi:hypothetical protein